jgi:hypothetical protein
MRLGICKTYWPLWRASAPPNPRVRLLSDSPLVPKLEQIFHQSLRCLPSRSCIESLAQQRVRQGQFGPCKIRPRRIRRGDEAKTLELKVELKLGVSISIMLRWVVTRLKRDADAGSR